MRIHQLGEGTPEVAVVGAIHGDEPCGVTAIERLVEEDPDVERPVKLIVANEEAIERGTRFVDEDLNRAFPGDPDASGHERRLAAHLARELRDCTVLSIHSTQSYGEPFALVDTVDAVTRSVCPHLPIDVLVETAAFTEGRLIMFPHVVEVEAGFQGSPEAAENAYWLARGFLHATGVLAAPMAEGPLGVDPDREVTVFRLSEPIPKGAADSYEVFAANFERVEAGEVFAAAGEDRVVADESFYPVLLSAYGYEDVFGYAAERVGTL